MTSEKQLAAKGRNALLSTRATTEAGRLALRRNTLRLAGQIDAAKSPEQLFADLVASPGCFVRITAAEHRIRAGMWRSMRKLVDLQALRSAVETARDARTPKNGFEFSNDQIARHPSPSKKAKVIPIDSYRPPNSPAAA